MIGNISKSKGFRGDKGDKGDFVQPYFGIDEDGNLYCDIEYVPSLKTAPYIGDNGHWYVFEPTTQKFYDTGFDARGEIPVEVIEPYIASQTADINSKIASIENRINTHAHFKGYFATDADVQSTAATPNDFAYSAESGKVWIFADMGDGVYMWQRSETDVPNQSVPASDVLPLMNGEAQAGQSNEYSRSDHVHPTDESRLSVNEFNAFKNSLGDIGGTGSSVFVVQFDRTNLTADKSYDEIFAATRMYKTVMLYDNGNNFLANFTGIDDGMTLCFVSHSVFSTKNIVEYQCDPDEHWYVASTEFVLQSDLTNLEEQVGDIDKALDNIIAKYGLDGGAE